MKMLDFICNPTTLILLFLVTDGYSFYNVPNCHFAVPHGVKWCNKDNIFPCSSEAPAVTCKPFEGTICRHESSIAYTNGTEDFASDLDYSKGICVCVPPTKIWNPNPEVEKCQNQEDYDASSITTQPPTTEKRNSQGSSANALFQRVPIVLTIGIGNLVLISSSWFWNF